MLQRIALLAVVLMLSGCVSGLSVYDDKNLSERQALVLVGTDSDLHLGEARYCPGMCIAWYKLGARRDVLAFPVRVGSTFVIDTLHSGDGRIAPLNGRKLKVEKRGVYYYGTIAGTVSRVGFNGEPNVHLLLGAKRKYGKLFDGLEPVDFTWPDPELESRHFGFGYQASPEVQKALAPHAGKQVQLKAVAPIKKFDGGCRGGGDLALPDFLAYEEYLRRAFNREMSQAGLYDESAGAITLVGEMTVLEFSTMGQPYWKMGMKLSGAGGHSVSAEVKVPFKFAAVPAQICPVAEELVPSVVQDLFEKIVVSPAFEQLLAAPLAAVQADLSASTK